MESLKKLQAEKRQVADSTGALQATNEQLETTVQDLEARVHTSTRLRLSLHKLPFLVCLLLCIGHMAPDFCYPITMS